MKIGKHLKIGWFSGGGGSRRFHPWKMAIIFAGFVVIGFTVKKLPWTISSPELQRTCLVLVIFNQPTVCAIIEREVKDGNQK